MNHETLVVRASCPLDVYLITPGSAVFKLPNGGDRSPDAAWIKTERWEAFICG